MVSSNMQGQFRNKLLGGRWAIRRLLARGGGGEVYAARDQSDGRRVAVKVLSPSVLHEPAGLGRAREALSQAVTWHHPNIVRVLDHHLPSPRSMASRGAQEPAFVVMERLTGQSLAARVAQVGPLPSTDALLIASQVLAALTHAHGVGVLHLGLTPGNILLRQGHEQHEDFVRVCDFGCSSQSLSTGPGEQGRPPRFFSPYSSPAQLQGQAITPFTDLHAVGAILFFMVYGKPPYIDEEAPSIEALKAAQNAKPIPWMPAARQAGPDWEFRTWSSLVRMGNCAMSQDPSGRFESATALITFMREELGDALPQPLVSAALCDEAEAEQERQHARLEAAREPRVDTPSPPARPVPAYDGAVAKPLGLKTGVMDARQRRQKARPPAPPDSPPADRLPTESRATVPIPASAFFDEDRDGESPEGYEDDDHPTLLMAPIELFDDEDPQARMASDGHVEHPVGADGSAWENAWGPDEPDHPTLLMAPIELFDEIEDEPSPADGAGPAVLRPAVRTDAAGPVKVQPRPLPGQGPGEGHPDDRLDDVPLDELLDATAPPDLVLDFAPDQGTLPEDDPATAGDEGLLPDDGTPVDSAGGAVGDHLTMLMSTDELEDELHGAPDMPESVPRSRDPGAAGTVAAPRVTLLMSIEEALFGAADEAASAHREGNLTAEVPVENSLYSSYQSIGSNAASPAHPEESALALSVRLERAAALWERWEQELFAPFLSFQELARGTELELHAHLGTLALAGDAVAEGLLLPALTGHESARVVAAALALLASGQPRYMDTVLDLLPGVGPDQLSALARALELSSIQGYESRLLGFALKSSPWLRAAALNVLAFHRVDLGPELDAFFHDEVPVVMKAGLRAARSSVGQPFQAFIEWCLRSPRPDVRDAALITGLMHGVGYAWRRCHEVVLGAEKQPRTAMLLLTLLGGPDELQMLMTLGQRHYAVRADVVYALGYSGHLTVADLCLAVMPDPLVSRLAAEAFCAITGLDLRKADLILPPPPSPMGPSTDDRERLLPFPDVAGVRRYWVHNRHRFNESTLYMQGAPMSLASLLQALHHGPLRRRHALCMEVAIRTRGAIQPQTRAFTSLQLPDLERLARLDPRRLMDPITSLLRD